MVEKTAKILSLFVILTVLTVKNADAAFNTDVVGRSAVTSFAALLEALPAVPGADEGVWVLAAPDGGARFAWRRDVSDARVWDVFIRFDARPFVKAGLDLSKLPDGVAFGDEIVLGSRLSPGPLSYEGEVTPLASFEQIVRLDRASVGYHAALDHYGVTVSEGSLFEWAKDMGTNDKDMVFVLNPKIFIDAGVDPAKVEGWAFAPVPVEDDRGRKFEADKFLKPFDLK
ncbi:MAG: hypothetical protein LBQ90_11920 [Synergistaceae bacterium]|nr:hypothetical protein [Synergistaceae bacterium]